MSKVKIIVSGTKLKCDKCGEYYETDEGGNFVPGDTTGDDIEDCAFDEGWVERNGKHYCPNCQ